MEIKLPDIGAIESIGINEEIARAVLDLDEEVFFSQVIPLTKSLRERYFGNRVNFCSIVNAKSGACAEDCAFCAQSALYKEASSPIFPLISSEDIFQKAQEAEGFGGTEFSIVTSGRGMTKSREIDVVVDAVSKIRKRTHLESCASLGFVRKEDLKRLKEAGMVYFHHNIETARSFFPKIVTTHSWEEEVEVIVLAKELGLRICCGGIIGMGESLDQRVEFAFQLREIAPDSVPINFLNPRPGTPLEDLNDLTPLDCLKMIAILRLVLPKVKVIVCGGREVNLREYQKYIYDAGASGAMLGNYLTTKGMRPEEDLQQITELGLAPTCSTES